MPEEKGMRPIWYFVGWGLLIIGGMLILAGIYILFFPYPQCFCTGRVASQFVVGSPHSHSLIDLHYSK